MGRPLVIMEDANHQSHCGYGDCGCPPQKSNNIKKWRGPDNLQFVVCARYHPAWKATSVLLVVPAWCTKIIFLIMLYIYVYIAWERICISSKSFLKQYSNHLIYVGCLATQNVRDSNVLGSSGPMFANIELEREAKTQSRDENVRNTNCGNKPGLISQDSPQSIWTTPSSCNSHMNHYLSLPSHRPFVCRFLAQLQVA